MARPKGAKNRKPTRTVAHLKQIADRAKAERARLIGCEVCAEAAAWAGERYDPLSTPIRSLHWYGEGPTVGDAILQGKSPRYLKELIDTKYLLCSRHRLQYNIARANLDRALQL